MAFTINHRDTKFLLCSVCKEYLSCGPVIIKKERYSICGRCNNGQERGIRNRYYEVACKHLRFPCKYRCFGCRETQPFAECYQFSHEFSCEFKPYKCMLANEDEECRWYNLRSKLADHCETQHPGKLLNNCCTLDIDVSYSHARTYLFIAFEMEFVLSIEVSLSESDSKISLLLQFLGKQIAASQFQYILNIKKNKSVVTKIGNCKQLPIPNEVGIENLKDLFNGMEGVTFHLTVFVECETCHCELICGKLFNYGKHWNCTKCTPRSKYCENINQGCSFKDLPSKILKHEEYFCKYATNLVGVNILSYGKVWKVKKQNDKCAITTDAGLVVCEFTATRTEDKFEIFLYSPLRSDQLNEFNCQINLGNSYTGENLTFHPEFEMYKEFDWYADINKADHPSWGSEIGVHILIQRIPENPAANEYLYY